MNVDEATKVASGALFWWTFQKEDGSAAAFIHRSFRQVVWQSSKTRQRLKIVGGVLAWPIVVTLLAGFFTWRNGSNVLKRTGKGFVRQFVDQVRLAATHSILPPWYYIFELHDDDKYRKAGLYLNRFETKRWLYPFLRVHNGGLPVPNVRTTVFLSNKVLFSRRCQEFGIPAVPTLLVFEKGKIAFSDGARLSLPKSDLFVKYLRGTGGKGALRWDYSESKGYIGPDGIVQSENQFIEHLTSLSLLSERGFLVQPRVRNHPAIADLSNGALATVRIMTCRNERGEYEVTNAAFRMAQGRNEVVDNFHAGGIVAKVDISSGELGRATDGGMPFRPGTGWCDRHPDTGALIAGRRLPFWSDMTELVRRAHTVAFSDQVVVGWDVALIATGPCLVEANKGSDVDLIQRSHEEPLGSSRLGELLAYNLRRCLSRGEDSIPQSVG